MVRFPFEMCCVCFCSLMKESWSYLTQHRTVMRAFPSGSFSNQDVYTWNTHPGFSWSFPWCWCASNTLNVCVGLFFPMMQHFNIISISAWIHYVLWMWIQNVRFFKTQCIFNPQMQNFINILLNSTECTDWVETEPSDWCFCAKSQFLYVFMDRLLW